MARLLAKRVYHAALIPLLSASMPLAAAQQKREELAQCPGQVRAAHAYVEGELWIEIEDDAGELIGAPFCFMPPVARLILVRTGIPLAEATRLLSDSYAETWLRNDRSAEAWQKGARDRTEWWQSRARDRRLTPETGPLLKEGQWYRLPNGHWARATQAPASAYAHAASGPAPRWSLLRYGYRDGIWHVEVAIGVADSGDLLLPGGGIWEQWNCDDLHEASPDEAEMLTVGRLP